MTPEQLEQLKAAALKAWLGDKPWREGTLNVWDETTNQCVAVTWRNQLSKWKQQSLANYIALANPQTILDLIAEVARLREHIANLEHDMNETVKFCDEHHQGDDDE